MVMSVGSAYSVLVVLSFPSLNKIELCVSSRWRVQEILCEMQNYGTLLRWMKYYLRNQYIECPFLSDSSDFYINLFTSIFIGRFSSMSDMWDIQRCVNMFLMKRKK